MIYNENNRSSIPILLLSPPIKLQNVEILSGSNPIQFNVRPVDCLFEFSLNPTHGRLFQKVEF